MNKIVMTVNHDGEHPIVIEPNAATHVANVVAVYAKLKEPQHGYTHLVVIEDDWLGNLVLAALTEEEAETLLTYDEWENQLYDVIEAAFPIENKKGEII